MKYQDFSIYKKIFTIRSEDTIFIFHMWGYCYKWHLAINDYFGRFENE